MGGGFRKKSFIFFWMSSQLIVKKYIQSKTKARVNVGPLKVNNVAVCDNQEMAEVLNGFFVNLFT